MAYALTLIGLLMVISAARGTEHDLANQVAKDFTGQDNFIYWLSALAVIGGIGYVPQLKRFSDTFMALLILSFILSQKSGVWTNLTAALSGKHGAIAPVTDTVKASSSGSSSGGGGLSLGGLGGLISGALSIFG